MGQSIECGLWSRLHAEPDFQVFSSMLFAMFVYEFENRALRLHETDPLGTAFQLFCRLNFVPYSVNCPPATFLLILSRACR
jgi:hypothetical protein